MSPLVRSRCNFDPLALRCCADLILLRHRLETFDAWAIRSLLAFVALGLLLFEEDLILRAVLPI